MISWLMSLAYLYTLEPSSEFLRFAYSICLVVPEFHEVKGAQWQSSLQLEKWYVHPELFFIPESSKRSKNINRCSF